MRASTRTTSECSTRPSSSVLTISRPTRPCVDHALPISSTMAASQHSTALGNFTSA
ncbi:hypothetical protein PhiBTCVTUL1a_09 [Burkholderia phage phiBtTUL1a]|nr:hypothetical protein PhiBTCVTUL1a_09 [Burkholderia phage phiBtTUL1a]